jgi:hypothetical protein
MTPRPPFSPQLLSMQRSRPPRLVPIGARALLLLVHFGSERLIEAVRQRGAPFVDERKSCLREGSSSWASVLCVPTRTVEAVREREPRSAATAMVEACIDERRGSTSEMRMVWWLLPYAETCFGSAWARATAAVRVWTSSFS